MKKILLAILLLFTFSLTTVPFVHVAEAKAVKVKGYTTKKGKYVKPYFRTSPNKIKYDNYSTKGNTNPYTGKKGYTKIK